MATKLIKWILFFVFLASIISSAQNANILGIFHYPSYSHQVVYQSLIRDLSARGHHLTILTTDEMRSEHPNVTEIHMPSSYDDNINFVQCKQYSGLSLLFHLIKSHFKRTERQLSQPEVQNLIRNFTKQSFDLLIIEYLFPTPMLSFGELYNIPVIGISAIGVSVPVHELMGNEVNPVVHPEIVFPYQHGRLSFFERINSVIFYLITKYFLQPISEIIGVWQSEKYFPSISTSLTKFEQRIDLVFVNTNPAIDYVRPLTPNTIQLGFMHVQQPRPLSAELKNHLDCSKHGVIYVNFGSNVKSRDLSESTISIFLNVFRNISFDVLWKYEDDEIKNKSENVLISKWFPQSDLLAHKNVKLFITQGGLMSLEEAIDRTVPLIVIPFLLDQHQNGLKVQEEGLGLRLQLENISEKHLYEAIQEVIKPDFQKRIENFKKLVNDQPVTSREKAVWWTEHVIRHKGAKHMKHYGKLISSDETYWLHLVVFIGCLISGICYVIYIIKKNIFFKQPIF